MGKGRRKKGFKQQFHAAGLWDKKPVRPCHYCGIGLTRYTATIEHVVPLSKGGTDSLANTRIACQSCNVNRSNGDYAAFKEKMLPIKQARLAGQSVPVPTREGMRRMKYENRNKGA
jgi:5-methylcytosine-specific restriction endonuclease McrA